MAAHESGHTVVALALERSCKVSVSMRKQFRTFSWVRQWFDLLVLNFVLADGLLKLRWRQAGGTSKCARKARLRRVLTIKGNLAE